MALNKQLVGSMFTLDANSGSMVKLLTKKNIIMINTSSYGDIFQ